MMLPKFNKPLPNIKRNVDVTKLDQIKSLLQRRYKQKEIAEMMGMTSSALSDFMSYHGLRKPK